MNWRQILTSGWICVIVPVVLARLPGARRWASGGHFGWMPKMLTSPLFFGHHRREVCFELVDWSIHFGYAVNTLRCFLKVSLRLRHYFHFSPAATCLRDQCSSISGEFCVIESCKQKQNLFSRDFFSPPFRTIQNGGDWVTWLHCLHIHLQSADRRNSTEFYENAGAPSSTDLNITVGKTKQNAKIEKNLVKSRYYTEIVQIVNFSRQIDRIQNIWRDFQLG